MRAVSFTEAGNRLQIFLGDPANNFDMSLKSRNSSMETEYLLSSLANSEHLNRSIAQYKLGQVTQRELIDD